MTRSTWRLRNLKVPPYVLGSSLLIAAIMIWRATRSYPTGLFDLYPLYYGGKAFLANHNAYDLTGVAPPSHFSYQLFQVGNTYPLPAVLMVLPLTLLGPQAAGVVWMGLLTAGLLFALRLNRFPVWSLVYVPIIEGLRIEQFTIFVLIFQMIALWAWRAKKPWVLALSCAIMLAKPNHALVTAVVLMVLSRDLLRTFAAIALVWGSTFLIDPNWLSEWIPTLHSHHALLHQPILWPLALFAIPLLAARDLIGASIALQFLLTPFSGVYTASSLSLSVLDHPWGKWLMPLSFFWPIATSALGVTWGIAVTLMIPLIAASANRYLTSSPRGSSDDGPLTVSAA